MKKRPPQVSAVRKKPLRRSVVQVDLASILSINHTCEGCRKGQPCCCSSFEVCVTTRELDRIISVLPAVAKLCPDLALDGGYDNIFEEVEPGLFAIDTTEEGRCLFAYWSGKKTRCALHTASVALGYALEDVKPKACLLWPMSFSEGEELLSLADDALSFHCNTPKSRGSRLVSTALADAIACVYGEEFKERVKKAIGKGTRSTIRLSRC